MCAACDNMRLELERFREAATIDIQNAHNDLIAKNREIGRLKSELSKVRDGEDDADEVRQVLLHWKTRMGKNGRTYIGSDGKRYKLAKAAVKRWGLERCKAAVDGIAAFPYAGPRGRTADAQAGAKRFDDIEHCMGDEVRFERAEELAKPPEEKPLPKVKVAVLKSTPPIQLVLGALNERGLDWQPGQADSWSAQCPAHDDHSPSLSIRENDRGDVLLHCFAGCENQEIVAALGLGFFDLFAVGLAA